MRSPSVQSFSWETRNRSYTINDFFRPEVTGSWGIPILNRCDFVPRDLFPYDKRKNYSEGAVFGHLALHFFMDDACFQKCWLQPKKTLSPIQKIGLAITPDFSLYSDWSVAVQIWQTYRTRWLGAYWAANGVEVIPSVSWSDERSYDFCFDGLPVGGTFAIATMEVSEPQAKPLFKSGLAEFLSRCNPTTLLVYGQKFKDFVEPMCDEYDCEVRRYSSRMDLLKKKLVERKLVKSLNAAQSNRGEVQLHQRVLT